MSQHTSETTTGRKQSTVPETSNEHSTQDALENIEGSFSEMDRPSVLHHQVEPLIAETLKEELHVEPLYEHTIDGEVTHEAWQFTETASEALVRITVTDSEGEDRVNYALPPVGETVLDLRWWAINCHVNDRELSIDHISNKAMIDMLSFTPETWEPGVTRLLYNSM